MNNKKAFFVQRFGAFVIDFMIVFFVVSLIASMFIDQKATDSLVSQSNNLMNNYVKEKIDTNSFISQYSILSYKIARNNGGLSLTMIVVNVLYFIVFQLYNKGQTIGKSLFKIRVVSNDGELEMNQMLFRGLIANSILMELISFAIMLFCKNDVYFYSVGVIEIMQYLIMFVSMIMILNHKDGRALHDKVVNTSVIRVN
ncbi:MAG: RDD family protein [Clostridia bacterium]|nr:RDD family protein [Clostridia bacterium]